MITTYDNFILCLMIITYDHYTISMIELSFMEDVGVGQREYHYYHRYDFRVINSSTDVTRASTTIMTSIALSYVVRWCLPVRSALTPLSAMSTLRGLISVFRVLCVCVCLCVCAPSCICIYDVSLCVCALLRVLSVC